jgi:hypothetical protein
MDSIVPILYALPWVPTMLGIWKHRLWSMLKVTYLGPTPSPHLMPT